MAKTSPHALRSAAHAPNRSDPVVGFPSRNSLPKDFATHRFVAEMERAYGRALRRFLATRMRHAAADVPDLVQEVFLRLLRMPDHDAIRNPQAYLYTIASHVLHDYVRQKAIATGSIEPLELALELEATLESDPAELAQLEQRFEALGRGLEQLSPRAYATLLLYRCEGATLEQIGQRLGVSRVMAKKYLMKAMAYCRQRLEELEKEEVK